MIEYKAPWSLSLKWISGLTTATIFIGAIVFIVAKVYFVAPLLLLLPIVAAPFTIRGYTLENNTLVVHRLFWNTTLPLAHLQYAEFNPKAMDKSWRTAGNGGLFSFSGYFSNKILGDYRALATNPKLSVILRFTSETIVVSPESPEKFVKRIMEKP